MYAPVGITVPPVSLPSQETPRTDPSAEAGTAISRITVEPLRIRRSPALVALVTSICGVQDPAAKYDGASHPRTRPADVDVAEKSRQISSVSDAHTT